MRLTVQIANGWQAPSGDVFSEGSLVSLPVSMYRAYRNLGYFRRSFVHRYFRGREYLHALEPSGRLVGAASRHLGVAPAPMRRLQHRSARRYVTVSEVQSRGGCGCRRRRKAPARAS